MSRILGIDPGNCGALCLLVGNTIDVIDMPTVKIKKNKKNLNQVDGTLVTNALKSFGKIDHAFMERVSAMPGQGVSSMFAFGRGVGVLEGVLAARGIPVTFVSPQTWQKGIGLSKKHQTKNAARIRAAARFPSGADNFRLVKHDGRADATLIAWYGRKFILSNPTLP